MDIIVKGVLDFIQTLKGRENTVIAGGAIRDELFNLEPNDYDFCIPSLRGRDVRDVMNLVAEEFKVSDPNKKSKEGYEQNSYQSLTQVYALTIEGKKIDLIGYNIDNDEEFGDKVIKGFDYGINMVYHNGSQICKDYEPFVSDWEYNEMTLRNLESISHLPNAMKRYEKFNTRLGPDRNLQFRSTVLELVRPKDYKKKTFGKLYGGGLTAWNNDAEDAESDVAEDGPIPLSPAQPVFIPTTNLTPGQFVTPTWDPWAQTTTDPAPAAVEAIEDILDDDF